jgi:hypothetical protein
MSTIENTVEVVEADHGPIFSTEELAAIETIANGGTVEGLDVSKLDHTVMCGLHTALETTASALSDVAGFLGAAITLRTWMRVPKVDGKPYSSELEFVEAQIGAHPVVAQIIGGTEVRRAVTAAITNITDASGKRVSDRRMAELLGVKKSTVNSDRNAAEGGTVDGGEGGEGGERGPQTGGQNTSDATAVKRHVTGYATAGTKVRDDLQVMTPEQIIATAEEARDTLSAVIAFATLQGVELPDWAVAFAKSNAALIGTAKPKLRSGAEGTVATGPVLAGAPVDPTATVAPAKPKPKPRAAAAS